VKQQRRAAKLPGAGISPKLVPNEMSGGKRVAHHTTVESGMKEQDSADRHGGGGTGFEFRSLSTHGTRLDSAKRQGRTDRTPRTSLRDRHWTYELLKKKRRACNRVTKPPPRAKFSEAVTELRKKMGTSGDKSDYPTARIPRPQIDALKLKSENRAALR